jgi:DNA-binding response OmpR family regulator
MAKILLVEDDLELTNVLKSSLTAEKHTVETASDGAAGLQLLRYYQFDLVILDLELPGVHGLDLLRQYRNKRGNTPVLILTGHQGAPADKAVGLDSGADDYLTKPFEMKELSARIRALLRRPQGLLTTSLKAGDLVLEPASRKLTKNGTEIQLLPKEFALLEFFMRHPNQVFSAEALLSRVWPSDSDTTTSAIRFHLTNLRSKIGTAGKESLIRTIHGQGYKLESPST